MIRFIHTADIHFGMENYGRIDAKTGIHTRLLDFYNALNYCIDYAINQEVDFFLFSGDAYKTAYPSPTQQQLLCKCFLRLFKAGIPVIIVVGNHDNPLSFGKAHALELFGQIPVDGFHVVSKPTSFELKTKSGPVNIVGIPWPSRTTIALNTDHVNSSASHLSDYISKGVTAIIEDFAQKLDSSVPAILAAHLTISSGIFSGSEKRAIYGSDPIFLPSQLAISPFDYVALGHLHRHQNLSSGNIPLVYAGSIERIDFGERKEEKGFCDVIIHDKNKTSYDFIKVPIRPFIQVDTHLDTSESQTDHILSDLKKHNLEDAILKIIYHVPAGKKDRVDISAIQQASANAHHLVGILPVRTLEIRDRRTTRLQVNMELPELLDIYFKSKPEWSNKRFDLIRKALELESETSNTDL